MEHGTLPVKRTKVGFDPNEYKLLAKVEYDPQNPNTFGKLILKVVGSKVHSLNKT